VDIPVHQTPATVRQECRTSEEPGGWTFLSTMRRPPCDKNVAPPQTFLSTRKPSITGDHRPENASFREQARQAHPPPKQWLSSSVPGYFQISVDEIRKIVNLHDVELLHLLNPMKTLRFSIIASLALLLCPGSRVNAQTTWNGTLSGVQSWNLGTNWTPATFPNAAGAVVNLNQDIAATLTVYLNQDITIGTLNFGDANGSHGIGISTGTGTNTLTFDSGISGGTVNLNVIGTGNATQTINTAISVAGTNTLNITGATQRLSTTGTINTNGNDIVLSGNTTATTIWQLSGNVTGGGRIVLNGLGGLLVSGNNTYTGSIIVNKGQGTGNIGSLNLTTGSMRSASLIEINGYLTGGNTQNGGTVMVGSGTGVATNPGQRLTQNVLTLNGGTLNLKGQPGSVAIGLIQDDVATLNVKSGFSYLTIERANNTTGTLLNVTSATRSAGATLFATGANLANAVGGASPEKSPGGSDRSGNAV